MRSVREPGESQQGAWAVDRGRGGGWCGDGVGGRRGVEHKCCTCGTKHLPLHLLTSVRACGWQRERPQQEQAAGARPTRR